MLFRSRVSVPADLPARVGWTVGAGGDLSIRAGASPVPAADVDELRLRAAFTE